MRVEVACTDCGGAFLRWPSGIQSERLFCSKTCNARYQAKEKHADLPVNFWARVDIGDPSECWEWTAYRNPRGYGQVGWMGKIRLTHRIAMGLTDGIWDSNVPVCHHCDNPPCCNPAHLWRGTHRQNQLD